MAMNYTTHALRIGTHGRSAFEYMLRTSGSDEHKSLPDQVAVLQSYPNPISVSGIYSATDSRSRGSVITIQFTLPSEMSATLRIFDMLGREVSLQGTLLNGDSREDFTPFRLRSRLCHQEFTLISFVQRTL